MHAGAHEVGRYAMVRKGGRRDNGGVDFANEVAVLRDGAGAGLLGQRLSSLGPRVDYRDQLDLRDAGGQPGVDSAQVADADDS
jgi:hypothetical protein